MAVPAPQAPAPLIFGEVLFDHFPDGSRVLGGAPFNVAWHLQGFGLGPRMISSVGADETGRLAVDRMKQWGMWTGGIQVDPLHPTGRVAATIVDGEPAFEIGIEQAYDFIRRGNALSAVGKAQVPLLYHGTLALRKDRSLDALDGLLRKSGAPTFVDLNLRNPWWTLDRLRWCLRTATWLKVNQQELATVTGEPALDQAACIDGAAAVAERHDIRCVVVTLGEEGSVLVADGRVAACDAEHLDEDELVDSVGAGDGFTAVVCAGLLLGWEVESLLRRANAFAADICRIRGATTDDRSLYERHERSWGRT